MKDVKGANHQSTIINIQYSIINPLGYHLDRICVKVKPLKTHKGLPLPGYESEGSSGMDIRACVEEPVSLNPGEIKLIPTGLSISISPGYEAQIRPRSGLALNHGIGIVNSPGTIDSDYRGEIGIILINWGGEFLHNQKRRSYRPDGDI